MKKKNLLSGLLAGALILTSVVVPGMGKEVKAEEYDLAQGLVASFSFEDDLSGGNDRLADAITVPNNFSTQDYTGEITYDQGQTGKAIHLDGYGLQLNTKNLGKDFTVSMWVKPDGNTMDTQGLLFLGYGSNSGQNWMAVSGTADNSTQYRFWGSNNSKWPTYGDPIDLRAGDWHQITVTGSADGLTTAYLDGKVWAVGDLNFPLDGENQDIRIGATYWSADSGFAGLIDEVKVYDRTLSEGEIYRLFDPNTSAETILDREGITATESMNMVVGRTQQIEVTMPAIVADSNPTVTYESSDTSVATVSDDGVVTAVGDSSTTITTTVKLGSVEKTAKTTVTVTGSLDDTLVASFDFNGNLNNGVDGQAAASALVTGLGAYNQSVTYGKGRNGEQDQAVRLGDYGLKLNQQNLGTEYTVSLWVNSEDALAGNQVVLLLGHHSPENWIAISGSQNNTNKVKFWGNGGAIGTYPTLATSTIPSGEWHQITITGTAGSTTLYVDGISMGQDISNDPLSGENADIYLGVNYWDPEFEGLVDDVKVYNIAMTAEEVQDQARETFQTAFKAMVERTLTMNPLLGDNSSSAQIIYDLELPNVLTEGTTIEWSSSDNDVIAADGTVTSPETEQTITMTATVTNGTLTTKKEFTFTVPALDRSDLEALIAEAEKIDTTYLTDVSRERLEKAISNAKNAENSYAAVEKAAADLQLAMDNLDYTDEAENPFAHIADPVTEISLKEGETRDLFTVPDSVKDLVTVSYSPKDNSIVTYNNGTITAVGEGKAIVTATVTSKYDSFTMEYSTAVEVTSSGSSVDEGEVTDATVPANNAGNADLAGDSKALADAVLTEDDKEEVANGADAKIYLEVEDITDSVPEADKALVEEAKGAAQVGMYLDVTLWKQIGSAEPVAVENTNGTVTITFTVPASLRNTDPAIDRTYQIIRVHDGKADILACSYDKNSGIITFTTDKFSTYALVYTDKKVEVPDPAPGTGEDKPGNGSQNKDDGKDKAPQTGDTTNVFPMAAACVLAFTAAGTIVAVKVKRRK